MAIDELPEGVSPLCEIFSEQQRVGKKLLLSDAENDSPKRWFSVIDGAHRVAALLLLWFSGYEKRHSFEVLTCNVLDHRNCFVKTIAHQKNLETEEVAEINSIDIVRTIRSMIPEFKHWVSALNVKQNRAWHSLEVGEADSISGQVKKKANSKRIQLKASITGIFFLFFFPIVLILIVISKIFIVM